MKRDLYVPYFEAAYETRGIISVPLYSAGTCHRIMEWARSESWSAAEVHATQDQNGSGVHRQYRSAQSLVPANDSVFRKEFAEMMDQIIRPLIRSAWTTDFPNHCGTHLVRYQPGGFYVPHIDTIPEEKYRYFTFLCYLNDDFEGGETSFPQLNLSVKPESGKAILFPSSYLHGAEPVTRGEKYVLISWLTGRPPIDWLTSGAAQ